MAFFFFSHKLHPSFPLFFQFSCLCHHLLFFFLYFLCSLPKRFVFSCSKPLNYSSYLEQPLLFCCCRGATVDQVLRFFFFIIVITTLGRNLLFALICFFFSLSISVFDAILVSIKKKRQTSDFIDASFFSFTL